MTDFELRALSVLVVPTWPSVVISSSNTLEIHSLETVWAGFSNFAYPCGCAQIPF